ncbi:MAG: non-heme iron oxygenase ferredoxin subunit [Deinococcales bacterium]
MQENTYYIAKVSDFLENSMKAVELGRHDVLVIHQEGRFYALENRCSHDNNPLDDGDLLEGAVQCSRHGAKFNLETGKPTLPAVKKIRIYQTQILGDELYINCQEI